MNKETRIIEINGVKLAIDERTATVSRVDAFSVGDPVKLLYKAYSESAGDIKYAVIVGFDQFVTQPTITVAYLDYNEIKYAYINKSNKHEIIAVQSHDLAMEKTWVIDRMNDSILKTEQELENKRRMKNVFIEQFGKYFKDGIPSEVAT